MSIRDTLRLEESSAAFNEYAERIGLTELPPREVRRRKDALVKQIKIGFGRIERGESPTQTDGGILAIPTGLPEHIPQHAWDQVKPRTMAITAEIAGTNWKVYQSTKNDKGILEMSDPTTIVYPEDDRKVTFDEFVRRIAVPLAANYKESEQRDGIHENGSFIGAISLGFPHANIQSPDSPDIDAVLMFDKEGKGPKEWQIIDWDPTEQKSLAKAVRKELSSKGINNIERLVFINDTSAVALDKDAENQAMQENLEFFPNGNVGGSGTNSTLKGVNTEIGHVLWPTDAIYEKMHKNRWTQNNNPELETETGQYLALRLAAGIELLGVAGFMNNADALAREIAESSFDDPGFISKIANGQRFVDPLLQSLTKKVLERAGQVYGSMYASAAEVMLGERTVSSTPAAMLTEGSVIHKGHLIKPIAERTARGLGQPIKIIEASGAKGVTYLAMSKPYIEAA